MRKSTFYSISVAILIAMVIFFQAKLTSLPEDECEPYFGFECEVNAIGDCIGGDYMGSFLSYSQCIGYTCFGLYDTICFNDGYYISDSYCIDTFCDDCMEN